MRGRTTNYPTGHFANLEPHNLRVSVFELHKICRSTVLGALFGPVEMDIEGKLVATDCV